MLPGDSEPLALHTTIAFGRRPEIASQAAGQALTLIVDLDKLLPTVVTATHTATLTPRNKCGGSLANRWFGALGFSVFACALQRI